MNNERNSKYSNLALILSLVAFIVAITSFLARAALKNGMLLFLKPDNVDITLQISAALTVLALAAYAFIEPDAVRNFLGRRQARYGGNLLIMSVAFLAIVYMSNSIVYNVCSKSDKFLVFKCHSDFTEDKENTLSPEMIRALEGLPAKMTATAFYSQQVSSTDARDLLQNMKATAGGNFDYTFVDPVQNPLAAKNAGVTGDGKIALEINGHTEVAAYADEGEVLLAIVRLLNPENRTVYFLVGHGEADIEGNGERNLTRVKETLETKNYTVKTLNLLAEKKIPDDAQAIIVAGPTKPVSANEVSLLVAYSLHGGALIVMEDPLPLTDFEKANDPLANFLESTWGLRLRNDFVVDTVNTSNIADAIGSNVDVNHPITRTMNFSAILHLARSIEMLPRKGITQSAIVQTGDSTLSWGETDFAPLEDSKAKLVFDEGVDTPGPLVMAAAAENADGLGRVVLIGNSFFATDEGFDVYGNGDLFINSLEWAVGQEDTIGLTPKPHTQRTLKLPESGSTMILIEISLLCLIPGVVIGLGIYAWAIRRKRG